MQYRFLILLPDETQARHDPGRYLRASHVNQYQWRDIEALFKLLGAEIEEREGSRVAVILFGEVQVFHRPHPEPTTNKGAVASVRKWLDSHGVSP